MQNRDLLFIPDISGFTEFITQTEIEHSRLIIQELLEVLINANKLGLEVSEIEGDAILFYRYGDAPALEEIFRQVEEMFCAFHHNLKAYDMSKYCQCSACLGAAKLTLKVITHYGEFTGYNVHNFQKLIGRDIIIAHQLLKNDIPLHEYWLVTKNLVPGSTPADLAGWMMWDGGVKQTETGAVPFHFTQLAPLRQSVPEMSMPLPDLQGKRLVVSDTEMYDTDLITLFHATGNFSYRRYWQYGVLSTEEMSHFLPRVGMRYKSLTKDGEKIIYSMSYHFGEDWIEFTERDEQGALTTRHFLRSVSPQQTQLTIEYYIRSNRLNVLLYNLRKRNIAIKNLRTSLENLRPFVNDLHIKRQGIFDPIK